MNKANQKLIKEQFDRYGELCFSLEWRGSKDYGHNCALIFRNQKVDLASGCGYSKDTAMIESFISACIGHWVSLGANRLDCQHESDARKNGRLTDNYTLECLFDGKRESGYIFRRKQND